MSATQEAQSAQKAGHGTVCWNELNVHDVERAKNFYSTTLGWTFDAMPMPGFTYWIIKSGDAQVGGTFEMKSPDFKDVPERWITYVAVDDVDARIAKATEAGANVCHPPMDIPGVGRMVMLTEPGGALVSWMTPKPF